MQALRAVLSELRVAPLYRSAPVSPILQPFYLNSAVTGRSRWRPEELLALLKAIEHAYGRRADRRWAARPLDLDLLLYAELELDRRELTLPHPRLAERAFFLLPLVELAPGWRIPGDGRTVAELAGAVAGAPGVELVAPTGWADRFAADLPIT